jgi:CheY-like chemotaxis protein
MRRTPDLNDIADILVVDDTPENLQLLSEMLKSWIQGPACDQRDACPTSRQE